jgi:hypothetical protein
MLKRVWWVALLTTTSLTTSLTSLSQVVHPTLAPAPGARKTMRAVLPEDCKLELDDGSILFTELEINDGCVVTFESSISDADIVVQKLILHGNSTIDLFPKIIYTPVLMKPPTPPQASNNPPSQRGQNGARGSAGVPGSPGINLKLNVVQLVATDGSLWIKTDGSPGFAGGPGGDGAKGAGPATSGTNCHNGGDGGDGGPGGNGGPGGATAKVVLTVGARSVLANRTPGVSPSLRPADANIPGAVVAAGSPGAGGQPGLGGSGGPEGEGRTCHFPATDAHPGAHGHNGPNGSPGPIGTFVP